MVEMAVVTTVDFGEIPGSTHNRRVGLASGRAAFDHDESLGIGCCISQRVRPVVDRVWRHPHAALEESKMTGSEQAVQLAAESDRIAGQIEKHDAPTAVPGPPPTGDRVAAAKGGEAARFGEPHDAGGFGGERGMGLDQALPMELSQAAGETLAPSPAVEIGAEDIVP